MAYSQENRFIAIDTPLGDDVLLLRGFSGYEGLSRLFRFDLDLLSEDTAIPFADIVGQNVTLTIALADGSTRYFNGFISRFVQKGGDLQFTYYQAEMVPWLWFLTRTADCRIFQNMTVPDIIMQIFRDLGFSDFKVLLQGAFEPRDYCVQYRETDLNFVSRLMEQYGIFYFFEHEKDKHTLVLANSPTAHQPCPGQPKARCDFTAHAVLDEDIIHRWQMEQELRPGKYALTDYNFETPSTSLAVNVTSTVNVGGNSKFEVYDYPGEYLKKAEGDHLSKLRMEEEEAPHLVVNGASTCRAFTPGYRFDLEGHYNQTMDTAYVLTEVQHAATVGANYPARGAAAGESYSNHFLCIPYDVPYRPPRVTPRPIVQGPQTAMVVGKAGEEIWTDKYGRVKVQFHWDREGKRNENSSCWIRVSHPWAGKGWGAVSIPRMGQEVIVDFLEGDPDQPIITGRVYNAEQMPPYELPANQTQSGVKSRSSKDGTPDNFNEIRFEDKKGEEQLSIHAEKDMSVSVENDQSISVGHDRTKTVKHDETNTIQNNRTTDINEGNDRLTVKTGHRMIDINTGNHQLTVMTGHRTVTINTGNDTLNVLTGEQTVNVNTGNATLNVLTQDRTVNVNTGNANLNVLTKDRNVTVATGSYVLSVPTKDVVITAGDKIIVIGNNEVMISSAKINISNTITINTQGITTGGTKITTSAVGVHEISGALVKIN
jgi:type VI secretion system secreted protein VgrG